MKEEHILRMLENMVLRRMSGQKWEEIIGAGENYMTRSFITCTIRQ
jgi:hypothetical protein